MYLINFTVSAEVEGTTTLQTNGNYLTYDTASHSRRFDP